MKLTGSRTTNTFDIFSDWDYHVDSQQDFEQIAANVAEAAAWDMVRRGNLCIVTVIDRAGTMWDYSGGYDQFPNEWDKLGGPLAQDKSIYNYWIIAFKSLKGLYRDFDEFVAFGIEMLTGLAREIYLGRKYDIHNFKNFYTYKQIAPVVEADSLLKQITGLAYGTRAEKLLKLENLNRLVLDMSRDVSEHAYDAFQLRVQDLVV